MLDFKNLSNSEQILVGLIIQSLKNAKLMLFDSILEYFSTKWKVTIMNFLIDLAQTSQIVLLTLPTEEVARSIDSFLYLTKDDPNLYKSNNIEEILLL